MVTDIIAYASIGFGEALTLQNLWMCFVGVLLGTLVGVLPGLSPGTTIALLLPTTYALGPSSALIMLAGIYYGAQYGGSTTAILVNMPGEASSVVTCLDGYQMARQGRAGAALAIAALASFLAGTVATVLIMVAAPWIAAVAHSLTAPDYFSLMVLGLLGACALGQSSLLKSLIVVLIGILLGTIGTDVNSGAQRFTLGIAELFDGLGFIPLAIGLFGIAELIRGVGAQEDRSVLEQARGGLWPSREEFRRSVPAALRGTAIGSLLGALPGGGAAVSSLAAYGIEMKVSRDPTRFGKGAPEGVAAAESANNAAAQTAFVPLLILGIPENAVMALMAGAMIMNGLQPGPNIIATQPQLFWGVVASMWIGNLMLLVLNLPLVGIWASLLRVRFWILAPIIALVSCIGVYSVDSSPLSVTLLAIFGPLGFLLSRLGADMAPMLLGFILGPMMEEYFRRAMILAKGDLMAFVERPISASILLIAVALVGFRAIGALRGRKAS